jgi:hypothetical protein
MEAEELDLPVLSPWFRLVRRLSAWGGALVFSFAAAGAGLAGQGVTGGAILIGMEGPAQSFSPTNHHAQRAGFICELEEGRFSPLTAWIEP